MIFEVYAMGNTAQLDFCGDMNWAKSSQHHYAIGLTWEPLLESYTLRKWWKLEQFRFILMIFEVYATGNTAQLDFCGRYELSHVSPTPLYYRFDLGTTSKWYTLRRW